MAKTHAPFGSWPSPITTDLVLSSAVSLGDLAVAPTCRALAWTEGRPEEKGRNALVFQHLGGEQEQVLPDSKWNARTRSVLSSPLPHLPARQRATRADPLAPSLQGPRVRRGAMGVRERPFDPLLVVRGPGVPGRARRGRHLDRAQAVHAWCVRFLVSPARGERADPGSPRPQKATSSASPISRRTRLSQASRSPSSRTTRTTRRRRSSTRSASSRTRRAAPSSTRSPRAPTFTPRLAGRRRASTCAGSSGTTRTCASLFL